MNIIEHEKSDKFKDNQRPDDMSFTSSNREFRPLKAEPLKWQTIVALSICSLVVYIVLSIIYGAWKIVRCWGIQAYSSTCVTLTSIEPVIYFGSIIVGIGVLIWAISVHIRAYTRTSTAYANRLNLTLNRYGDQEPADLFERLSTADVLKVLMTRYALANDMQIKVAPHQIYKGVNTLSNAASQINPNLIATTMPELVPDRISPIPPDNWLTWLDKNAPHILLSSSTGSGKTVTAKAIIAKRIAANEQICIIDPHSDSWFNLPIVGGGENWNEISDAIAQLYELYKTRLDERDQFLKANGYSAALPNDMFNRVTVLLDEAYITSLHLSEAPKGKISIWELFTQVFGSGARKLGISVIMLSQTSNVEDLGISGPLRENFNRIALDERTIKQMIANEEKDVQRKRMLYESLAGLSYPATSVFNSRVELLDRTGIDQLPALPAAHPYVFVRPIGGVSEQIDPLRTNERTSKALLRQLRLSGVTREQARNTMGLHFTDEDWILD